MQFYSKISFDSLKSNIKHIMFMSTLFVEIYCVKGVEQNPLPKSQTKPFYIGTKEAPSENEFMLYHLVSSFILKVVAFTDFLFH